MNLTELTDPALRAANTAIAVEDGKALIPAPLPELLKEMFEVMYETDGVGLAAPQVGYNLQVFIYDDRRGNSGVFLNPTLIMAPPGRMRTLSVHPEGCLSLPGVSAELSRASLAMVQGFDEDGNPKQVVGEGFLARIFQHECDHLNGALFIDRLSTKARKNALAA